MYLQCETRIVVSFLSVRESSVIMLDLFKDRSGPILGTRLFTKTINSQRSQKKEILMSARGETYTMLMVS